MTENPLIDTQIQGVARELETFIIEKRYGDALLLLEDTWLLFNQNLSTESTLLVGRILLYNGYTTLARNVFDDLILIEPSNANVIRWWVQSYAELKNDDELIIVGEIANSIPVPISTVEHLADCLFRNGNFERGMELLNRNAKRLQERGHLLRMHYYFYEIQDYSQVVECLIRIPEAIRMRSEFSSHLALAYAELGRIEEALNSIQHLIKKGCMNACFTKFDILRQLNRDQEAFDTINYTYAYHGLAPIKKSWKDNDFLLTELGTDELPSSDDERLVTVIMTVHKNNPMLKTAINSILNQTHKKLELLLIDDASQEKDQKIYHEFTRKDNRIKVIRQKTNSGTYSCRNLGIESARGEFVTFLDSDDWQHPQKVEHALDRLDENLDSVATLESYIRLSPAGRLAKVGSWFARKSLMGITWRTDILRNKLGGFDEVRVSADSELLERAEVIFGKSALIHKPIPMYVATHHDDSLTGGGPFAIGWKGIKGPRAVYVSSFRSWHLRMKSNPKQLTIQRFTKSGLFKTSDLMPRASAGFSYSDDKYTSIPNIASILDIEKRNLFKLQTSESKFVKEDITVCMASFPARFGVIGKAVESLLNQSQPPTKILIHINETEEIPPLPNDDRIEVHCSPNENLTDIGKFKMAGLVESGYVITVDDDIIYPNNYIQVHIETLNRYSNKVIVGIHGAVLPLGSAINTWEDYRAKRRVHWFRRGLSCDLPVQIVGTGTMSYHVNAIKFDWKSFGYQRMVDLHIAVAAQRSKIPMITPPRPENWMNPIEDEDETLEAIWDQVQGNTNLQNQMVEVLQSVEDWKIYKPNREFISKNDMKLRIKSVQEISGQGEHIPYEIRYRWRIEGRKLFFKVNETEVFFEMPNDWTLESAHEDLFRVAHYVLMAPWEKGILDDWVPSRIAGWRPGLAFSGGVDSVAAMLLMPQNTMLVYNRRDGFESGLNHTNADRLVNHFSENIGRNVIQIKSNHELIRQMHGKGPGFSTDYACAVQVILLADYLGLDSLGTGMPLENAYLFHGYKYRDFAHSWFWKHNSEVFSQIGLDLYQPVAGCSEVINLRIVKENELLDYAQSCLRSNKPGIPCKRCWKCFRKNTLSGYEFSMSNEIKTFLSKRPLKQAASTLYSIQKMDEKERDSVIIPISSDLEELLKIDFTFLENHHKGALALVPLKYRKFTQSRLSKYAVPMSDMMKAALSDTDLFPS
jgi:tetratricopeptide (TPR) repeat protein